MPNLRPLNEIMPAQQYQPQQPVQPQPQPAEQYQPQPAMPGNLRVEQLTNSAQMQSFQNNGRVEVVIQDRTRGHFVISADQLNISMVDQQTGGIGLGNELRMFDANGDGWLVEQELQTAIGSAPVGEGTSKFEHVASTTLGGGMFGAAVGGIAAKMGLDIGSKLGGKFAGTKGWMIGAGAGAAVGLVAGFITHKGNKANDSAPANVNGYRAETQWNESRLAKTVL
ncbi:hypothetical protein COW36_22830 [bacterium (Candidatus Blackallbacteria) CG17_big_fil_post_rev_8_21_14_2_50_48_46]|uniref:EF-hand domain-containing protein n=1 Tax=bacterium (Candidatus Blackallbacteria) CG17_big_fil_post_rev_8_21_14_2_50_48_46 TaxID=2014261 RepID=A0A2M7FYH2_9BACT|nr:MAG: hypothetical protein COW64_15900 [bacterium (Candidatus Blackallbacteria) CG18_big_fil_WC_8_21_14_2_50_49_26]PIW14086.1 MAG: hypothetical protein COW36_22830 [bacterium (Candidatus Blackallbacteria) CG17_big_fil_post_rev_8_21_14_2_50_48_46]PIW45816.1 MAG: hypothetical protein COW20_18495 [bacterium (Candidatus Blackallbacteria) CG13_big_fil_rev_8_21_14_2_50_49_14]